MMQTIESTTGGAKTTPEGRTDITQLATEDSTGEPPLDKGGQIQKANKTLVAINQALEDPKTFENKTALDSMVDKVGKLLGNDVDVLNEGNLAEELLSTIEHIAEEMPLPEGRLVVSTSSLVLAAIAVDNASFNGTFFTVTKDEAEFRDGEHEVILVAAVEAALQQAAGTDAAVNTTTKINSVVMASSLDVYGRWKDSAQHWTALSFISFTGCSVSLVALIVTIVIYILYKARTRQTNPSKILINLCVALALSNLVFLGGMQEYAFNNHVACKVVSVLLHFSLLASLCWMLVEGFYMYLALVLVFRTHYSNFVLKCSSVGWGVPLVVVLITLAVNTTDNYAKLESGICWLKGTAFYVAFVAPVCLILLLNVIAFTMVLRVITGQGRRLNRSHAISTGRQLQGAIGVVILLGLTWVFGFLAIDKASVVFSYLFAIFNTLQVCYL
nr:hypothetical protein BaRGS_014816 [Batillaria attramentaria]